MRAVDGHPVAEAVLHEAVRVRLRRRVGEILDERRVDLVEDAAVAPVRPEVPRDDGQRAVPARAIAPVVAPAGGGDDAGEVAVGELRVEEVPQPLLVGGRVLKEVLRKLARDGGVARPAVLLAVRAVGRHAVHEVAAISLVAHFHERVERRVRTREGADRGEGRVDDARHGVLGLRGLAQPLHNRVAEAVVDEAGLVGLDGRAGADDAIRLERGVDGADAVRGRVAEVLVDPAPARRLVRVAPPEVEVV